MTVVSVVRDAVVDLALAASQAGDALGDGAATARLVLRRHCVADVAGTHLDAAAVGLSSIASDTLRFLDEIARVDAEPYLTYVLADGRLVEVFGAPPTTQDGLRRLLAELTGIGTASVAGVADAWDALPDLLRDALVRAAPTVIGNLDGVAFADRAVANEANAIAAIAAIDADLEMVQAHLARLRYLVNHPLLQIDVADLRVAQVRELAALYAMTGGPARGDLEERARQREAMHQWLADDDVLILGLSDRGDRAIVSHGDPDTAARVVTLIPGATSHPGQFADGTAYGLYWDNLHAALPAGSATVAWVGYDAPSVLGAAFTGAAEEAATDLAPFLDATEARGSRQTAVIGHSYGSVVAAHTGAGLDVEVFVATGSPGIRTAGSGLLGHLDIPSETVVVAGTFGDDPIRFAPAHGLPLRFDPAVDVRLRLGDADDLPAAGDPPGGPHSAYGHPEAVRRQVVAIEAAWADRRP